MQIFTRIFNKFYLFARLKPSRSIFGWDQIYLAISSIFGSLPNISIWYSVVYQIYLVDIWSTIWLLFGQLFGYYMVKLL